MTEITNIKEIIDYGVSTIDTQIRLYERQIKNQGDYYDWERPSIEVAEKNILELLKKREEESTIIIEDTKIKIAELSKKFGKGYIVSYTKEEVRSISVHRENCNHIKISTSRNNPKFVKCETYKSALNIAFTLIKEIYTDIGTGCTECKPWWNLSAIKKSI
jgi:(p)ppGpp synthase/HD superfamily hydrolase